MTAFIIPCRFDPARPIIFQCVARIKEHHPDAKIVVVDSSSPDKAYLNDLNCDYIDADNVNYSTIGHYIGWQAYPNEDFYYFLFDSLFVNSSLAKFKDNPLTVIRYFNTPPTGWGWDQDGRSLSIWAAYQMFHHMAMVMPQEFTGILGPMWMCNNAVMTRLEKLGFFKIKPTNKYEACAVERIAGMALTRLGYDLTNCSLQGEMFDFFGEYDNTYVEKVHMARW